VLPLLVSRLAGCGAPLVWGLIYLRVAKVQAVGARLVGRGVGALLSCQLRHQGRLVNELESQQDAQA